MTVLRSFACLFLLLTLAGCATEEVVWSPPAFTGSIISREDFEGSELCTASRCRLKDVDYLGLADDPILHYDAADLGVSQLSLFVDQDDLSARIIGMSLPLPLSSGSRNDLVKLVSIVSRQKAEQVSEDALQQLAQTSAPGQGIVMPITPDYRLFLHVTPLGNNFTDQLDATIIRSDNTARLLYATATHRAVQQVVPRHHPQACMQACLTYDKWYPGEASGGFPAIGRVVSTERDGNWLVALAIDRRSYDIAQVRYLSEHHPEWVLQDEFTASRRAT